MKNTISIHQNQKPLPQQVVGEFDGYTIEICLHPNSLRTACRLRYRAYLAAGAIEENNTGMVTDPFDRQPGSFVYLVWYEGRPVATIRSCVYSEEFDWEPTEAVGYFTPSIHICLGQGESLIESNRFAVDPDFQGRQSLFAQMLLFRMHGMNALVFGCDHIITAVRQKHVPFYRRFLGMTQISRDAKYVSWANAHVALLSCKTSESTDLALERGVPPISVSDLERYFQCFQSRQLLRKAA